MADKALSGAPEEGPKSEFKSAGQAFKEAFSHLGEATKLVAIEGKDKTKELAEKTGHKIEEAAHAVHEKVAHVIGSDAKPTEGAVEVKEAVLLRSTETKPDIASSTAAVLAVPVVVTERPASSEGA